LPYFNTAPSLPDVTIAAYRFSQPSAPGPAVARRPCGAPSLPQRSRPPAGAPDVEHDHVTVAHQGDRPTGRRSGDTWPMLAPRVAR